jgi:hypothetical protein
LIKAQQREVVARQPDGENEQTKLENEWVGVRATQEVCHFNVGLARAHGVIISFRRGILLVLQFL